MRLLVITEGFPKVSETFIIHQVSGLEQRGHEIWVCATSAQLNAPVHGDARDLDTRLKLFYRGDLRQERMPAIFRALAELGWWRSLRCLNPCAGRQASTGRLILAAASLHKVAQEAVHTLPLAFDAVLAHFGQNGQLAVLLRDRDIIAGPIVTFFHGMDVGTKSKATLWRRYSRLFKKGDLFLAASDFLRERLAQAGVDRTRLATHHMGVPMKRFRQDQAAHPPAIITIGRLVEKKGIDTALRALAGLREREWNYHVIGDGVLMAPLKDLAEELGIAERVHFHGYLTQEAIVDHLARACLLLAPSRTSASGDAESCPLSISEACLAGVAVCATRHGGIPEMVIDGKSGYLVEEDDHIALTERITHLLDNPDVRDRMAKAGRAHIQAHWDVDELNGILERHLADLKR